ncbi:MAG: RagB/SusD family nutrient uptake outer membrane protein [Saprospiraceae bacterium]|nr:RagB/SusD family nutrient uptake outer membrane protein [Saprospiraceae bacterium]
MKTLLKSSLIVSLLAIGACTDLDIEPTDRVTAEVLFKDESAYRAFIARVYAGLAVTGQSGPAGNADISSLDEGFSNYLRQYWQLQELTTDEAVIGWGDEGLPDLHNHTWTPANQFVRAMYYRIFFQVSMANEFLRETTDDKLNARGVSDATRQSIRAYRAEARFLRALSYWHGMDLVGNIPFYTEESGFGSAPPPQATRREIFNFIDNELKAIENEMAAPGQNDYGRADRAAVWMLQAKLYLNARVYIGEERNTECIAACKKVIDTGIYSLEDNWRNLFKTDNHLSREIIFAIPFDGLSTQTWGGMTYLVHAPVGGSMNAADYGINGGWFGLRTTSALVDLFPDPTGIVDERANFYTNGQSKEINSISNFSDGYAVQKFTNVSSDGTPGLDLDHPDTDYPMFRLADAYLMYAEAVLRGGTGGDLGTALNYVNALRERAYNNSSGNLSAANLTLDFILNERARELYWEGHRRTDLVRFNQFTENGVWPWKGGVKEGRTTEAFRNLFPIPTSEILANRNLQQNTGY